MSEIDVATIREKLEAFDPDLRDEVTALLKENERLKRRNERLTNALKPFAVMGGMLEMKHKPNDEVVSIGVWFEPVPGYIPQFSAYQKMSAADFYKIMRLVGKKHRGW